MTETHRVKKPYVWLLGRHVEVGEKVWPGKPLFDIAALDGVIETVRAEGWGEIVHIEGELIRPSKFTHLSLRKPRDLRNDGGSDLIRLGTSLGAVYEEGAILCQIIWKNDKVAAGKAGLHPKRSWSVYLRSIGELPRLR